ncbi:galactokinase, partial [Ruminococcaceae bacterium OttesenSCG-928-I18]|nr:galactokinase [Ruminococcaceae bacterium OttesenSCG-928-I18]
MATAKEMLGALDEGTLDGRLGEVYPGGTGRLTSERQRYRKVLSAFAELYGADRPVSVYSAPGRCEIGGNHTDHNNGLVLAAAVDLDIIAVVSQNRENILRVTSEGFEKPDHIDLSQLAFQREEEGTSAALLRGLAAGFEQAGVQVGGFDAYTTSQVLRGSGLSSSAAFEVCMATAMNGEYNNGEFAPTALAILGQQAENEYFGKPSGLMDQMSSAVGGAVVIDFKNPQKPLVSPLTLSLSRHGHLLVITDTGGSHVDLTDDYAAIRNEMNQVSAYFGKETLRDVKEDLFLQHLPTLRRQTGDRALLRSMHFYAECRRVRNMQAAIIDGDFSLFL